MKSEPIADAKVIMVIDDSITIRKSAEMFLSQAGHQVVLSGDGFDALSKINDYQPDLIFCDIVMPRLDGYQTCSLIKRNRRFRSIPVVMLSSRDGLFDRARGEMAGSEQYLTKPFGRESLLETVNLLVNCADSARQGADSIAAESEANTTVASN